MKSVFGLVTLQELYEVLLPEERRWLGTFVILSALGHFAVLFFLPILTIEQERLLRPAPEVTIAVFSQDFDNWLDGGKIWLDVRDPRMISQPVTALKMPEGLQGARGKMTELALPEKSWSDLSDDIALISRFGIMASPQKRAEQDVLSLKPSAVPLKVEAPPALRGTGVTVIGDLEKRKIAQKLELPQPESSQAYGMTVVLLGVSAEGVVEFSLIEESSRSSELDEQALKLLNQWRFEEAEQKEELMWGRVLIAWDFHEMTKNSLKKLEADK